MLKAKSFLAIDCGAHTLKLAGFELNESGGLRLKQYAFRTLGAEGMHDATRGQALTNALEDALKSFSAPAKIANICAPGYQVFSKFVKLPPVDSAKVTQIIEYEAQQNVPFPLTEVVWDFQIAGTHPVTGELEVLLVAIKSDVVEGLYQLGERAGLKVSVVDVSVAALSNAFRFNYGDLTDCALLLDIGAKTSTALFYENGKIFSRSINVGANSITQEFANEFKLSLEEAERIKIEKGFVHLGGAYEDPDDPHAAAISKIARQVMTRLHMQLNQTIQYYRTQQGGSMPARLFLSGGASIMPFTAQFFGDKLGIPVDYFNPFRNVQIAPEINLEELAKVAHSMGELVGLGLRNLAHCPVELNLVPHSWKRVQEFNQKKPFILATLATLVVVAFCFGYFEKRLVEAKNRELETVESRLAEPQSLSQKLVDSLNEVKDARAKSDIVRGWLEERFVWAEVLAGFRDCLLATEQETEKELGRETGIWIEQMSPELPKSDTGSGIIQIRRPPKSSSSMTPATGTGGSTATNVAGSATNVVVAEPQITHVNLRVRALQVLGIPDGNAKLAYKFLDHLKARPSLFDTNAPNPTEAKGTVNVESNTFYFDVVVKLKRPITL